MPSSVTRSFAVAAALVLFSAAAEAHAQDASTPAARAREVDAPNEHARDANARQSPERDPRDSFLARDPEGNLIVVDDAAGFGRVQQWAFSSDAALSFQRQTTTNVRGNTSFPAVTSLQFAPAADYFIIENLSIGGVVGMTYQKAGESKSLRFSLGPRFGYNFEVSRLLSFWPKIGFSYAHTKNNSGQTLSPAGAPSGTVVTNTNANALAISIFVPFMFHPTAHFFTGFGPFTDTDLTGHNRSNVWGFKLTMGGWIDRETAESKGLKHVEVAEPVRGRAKQKR